MRAWTARRSICSRPTAPGAIFRRPTEFLARLRLLTAWLASLRFVTAPLRSCVVPTLPGGSWVAAQPAPPSATNRDSDATAIEGDSRCRSRRLTFSSLLAELAYAEARELEFNVVAPETDRSRLVEDSSPDSCIGRRKQPASIPVRGDRHGAIGVRLDRRDHVLPAPEARAVRH